jgi:hypothetical protein
VIGAATGSALFTSLVSYPLDFAHGRMAADMSKKPALIKDARTSMAGKGSRKMLTMQQQIKADRLYESVLDCLQNSRQQNKLGPFVGLPIAMASQVPYTVILMYSFEFFNKAIKDDTV